MMPARRHRNARRNMLGARRSDGIEDIAGDTVVGRTLLNGMVNKETTFVASKVPVASFRMVPK